MYHKPVLLEACLEGLALKESGTYVDATFGGGGHTKAILDVLGDKGKVIAFDQDADAVENTWDDDRLIFVHQNFKYLRRFLRFHNIEKVDGILADLGVSSHQLDTGERGFSTRFDGPLDMRMSDTDLVTAQEIINTFSEESLATIFYRYGELSNSRKIAARIVVERKKKAITTTAEFTEILKPLVPLKVQNKILAQIFQALRIEVNQELKALEALLEQSAEVLDENGRLCMISYHSLEDRLVKRFFQHGCFDNEPEKDEFGRTQIPLKKVGRMILPTEKEIKQNKRARSAKLRIAEKR
ncbi:MAG: 16S rRNA (cytosine(1402)-N(4))-methyltransferase RsmH [Flavobacteriaceae bacterium]|jgi:16S rRNA (cytosine1402-N4)-methyltransferase|nr:16S rRNA (cytosine(1402)-N(4))-methyltransferase RsmH [Flavobacteriaceae bacterium]MDG0966780.1 16S rRNA (cytosine(1402)-N(4))-methyltransferase RsmH [Flavobacteriaceae bacterium]